MQVIAHNLLSQFTSRQLNITSKDKSKSSERLASGYRINRSADDAAGLSISEKMRWQIRGLDKGKRNIMDGISLVDTADGALQETHSVLQRVRELTVQAYNDTYTESDRDAIQSEIDSCLAEIDRIAEDTTFNTIQVLKGNPIHTIKVKGDETIDITVTNWITKDIPQWLSDKMDKKLEVHNTYTQPQDTSGIMLKYNGTDDNTKEYYGPNNAPGVPSGYNHKGEWTNDISDNPSAKIDFSGLTNAAKADELYSNIFDLLGTRIAYPCGTCSTEVNGIAYTGSVNGCSVGKFGAYDGISKDIYGKLDLSTTSFTHNGKTYTGYFDAIQELLDKYGSNYDSDTTNDINGESADVTALAQSIAKDLRNKTADILSAYMANHFDRVVNGGDDYSLIVYDYRDDTALTNMHAADSSVKISSRAEYTVPAQTLVPGETVEAEGPMKIMCGALNSSYILLGLEDLSLDSLGLSSYKINRYSTVESYSESYKAKLQAWKDNVKRTTETRSYKEKVYDAAKSTPTIYGTKYVNGEPIRFVISKGKTVYKEETRSYTIEKVTQGQKPAADPGDIITSRVYTPDSLTLVDNAIEKVSRARSHYGAIKNRLEHAYNLNANTEENTQSAESKLRDADMAEEMVDYSKSSILEQAGQALLAQANQIPQGILKLFQ